MRGSVGVVVMYSCGYCEPVAPVILGCAGPRIVDIVLPIDSFFQIARQFGDDKPWRCSD